MRRRLLLILGAIAVSGAVVAVLGVSASSGSVRRRAPARRSLPKITGKARAGAMLRASSGRWRGARKFTYRWERCNAAGARCRMIRHGGHPYAGRRYKLSAADVGHRIRVAVRASNRWGSRWAASRATAVVRAGGVGVVSGSHGGGSGSSPPLSSNRDCLRISGTYNPSGTSLSAYPDYAALDACGYPSPDTAGALGSLRPITPATSLPSGWSYTAGSPGELYIGAGGTLANVSIPDGYVADETSQPVTLDHVLIRCGGCNSGSPMINEVSHNNLTITYSTLGGLGGGSDCTAFADADIGEAGGRLDHDVLDCGIVQVNGSGWTITNSYLIGDGNGGAQQHVEPVYIPGGGTAFFNHDTILAPLGATAGIFMDAKNGTLGPVTIENSLFSGAVGDGMITGGGPNVTIEDDRFSNVYQSTTAISTCSSTTLSGNYWDSNLSPVRPQSNSSC